MARRRGVAWRRVPAVLAGALLCLACVASVDVTRLAREDECERESAVGRDGQGDGRAPLSIDGTQGEGDSLPPQSDEGQAQADVGLLADLVATGGLESRVQEGGVEEVATSVLSSYRDQGDCVLASTGYLDLYGSVWSCVVRGSRWADVCIVSAGEDDSVCQVIVMRMNEDEVAALLEGDV